MLGCDRQNHTRHSPQCNRTLATLPSATAQQLYDQMALHMLKQGARSVSPDGDCAYRGVDGLMCPAGCLMSDEEYHEGLEERNWSELISDEAVPDNHWRLIEAFQGIHDTCSPEDWASLLITAARQFGTVSSRVVVEFRENANADG